MREGGSEVFPHSLGVNNDIIEEGHRTICSVKYLFGGDFTLARIFGEILFPLENSDIEFANMLQIDTYSNLL